MQLVVGAVIVDRLDAPRAVLAARRVRPAGRWEFPGGKVDPGETPLAALRRELREELAVEVRIGAELVAADAQPWPLADDLEMRLWWCEVDGRAPTAGADHDDLRWVDLRHLAALDWMDGDLTAVRLIVAGQRSSAASDPTDS